MREYIALFAPAFERPEQLERSKTYERGLLGDATRKNVEQMALGLGENVRNLQCFVVKARERPNRCLKSINGW